MWSATGMEGMVSLEYIAHTLCPPPSPSLPATNIDSIIGNLCILPEDPETGIFSCNLLILKQGLNILKGLTNKQNYCAVLKKAGLQAAPAV